MKKVCFKNRFISVSLILILVCPQTGFAEKTLAPQSGAGETGELIYIVSHRFPKHIREALAGELERQGYVSQDISKAIWRGLTWTDGTIIGFKDDALFNIAAGVLSEELRRPISADAVRAVLEYHEEIHRRFFSEKGCIKRIQDELSSTLGAKRYRELLQYFQNQYGEYKDEARLVEELAVNLYVERLLGNPLRLLDEYNNVVVLEEINPVIETHTKDIVDRVDVEKLRFGRVLNDLYIERFTQPEPEPEPARPPEPSPAEPVRPPQPERPPTPRPPEPVRPPRRERPPEPPRPLQRPVPEIKPGMQVKIIGSEVLGVGTVISLEGNTIVIEFPSGRKELVWAVVRTRIEVVTQVLSPRELWQRIVELDNRINSAATFKERIEFMAERNRYRARLWKLFKATQVGKYLRWKEFSKELGVSETGFKNTIFDYFIEITDGDFNRMAELIGISVSTVHQQVFVYVGIRKALFMSALAKAKEGEELTEDERLVMLTELMERYMADPTFPSFFLKTKTVQRKLGKDRIGSVIYLVRYKGKPIIIKEGIQEAFGDNRDVTIRTVFDPDYGWLFETKDERGVKLIHRKVLDKIYLELIDTVQETYVDSIEPKANISGEAIMPRDLPAKEFSPDYGPRVITEMARCHKFRDPNLKLFPFQMKAGLAGGDRAILLFGSIENLKYESGYQQVAIYSLRLKAENIYRIKPVFSNSLGQWVFLVYDGPRLDLLFTGRRTDGETQLNQLEDDELDKVLIELGLKEPSPDAETHPERDIWTRIIELNGRIEKSASFQERLGLMTERNKERERLWGLLRLEVKGKQISWVKMAERLGITQEDLHSAIYDYLIEVTEGDFEKIAGLIGWSVITVKREMGRFTEKIHWVRALKKIKKGEELNVDESLVIIREFLENLTDSTFPSFSFKARTKSLAPGTGSKAGSAYIRLTDIGKRKLRIMDGIMENFGVDKEVTVSTRFDPDYGWLFFVTDDIKGLFYRKVPNKDFPDLMDPVQESILDSIEPKVNIKGEPIKPRELKVGEFTLHYGQWIISEIVRCNKFNDPSLKLYPFQITAYESGEQVRLYFRKLADPGYAEGERLIYIVSKKLVDGTVYKIIPVFNSSLGKWTFIVTLGEQTILVFSGKEEDGKVVLYVLDEAAAAEGPTDESLEKIITDHPHIKWKTKSDRIVLQHLKDARGNRIDKKRAFKIYYKLLFLHYLRTLAEKYKDLPAPKKKRTICVELSSRNLPFYRGLVEHWDNYENIFTEFSKEIETILGFAINYKEDIWCQRDTSQEILINWILGLTEDIPQGITRTVYKTAGIALIHTKNNRLELVTLGHIRGMSSVYITFAKRDGNKICQVWRDEEHTRSSAGPLQEYFLVKNSEILLQKIKGRWTGKFPEPLIKTIVQELKEFLLKDGPVPKGHEITIAKNGNVALINNKEILLRFAAQLAGYRGKAWVTYEIEGDNRLIVIWPSEEESKKPDGEYIRRVYLVKDGVCLAQEIDGKKTGRRPVAAEDVPPEPTEDEKVLGEYRKGPQYLTSDEISEIESPLTIEKLHRKELIKFKKEFPSLDEKTIEEELGKARREALSIGDLRKRLKELGKPPPAPPQDRMSRLRQAMAFVSYCKEVAARRGFSEREQLDLVKRRFPGKSDEHILKHLRRTSARIVRDDDDDNGNDPNMYMRFRSMRDVYALASVRYRLFYDFDLSLHDYDLILQDIETLIRFDLKGEPIPQSINKTNLMLLKQELRRKRQNQRLVLYSTIPKANISKAMRILGFNVEVITRENYDYLVEGPKVATALLGYVNADAYTHKVVLTIEENYYLWQGLMDIVRFVDNRRYPVDDRLRSELRHLGLESLIQDNYLDLSHEVPALEKIDEDRLMARIIDDEA